MKRKTINAVISKKMGEWWLSIEDNQLRQRVADETIVTGGCIASMLLGEKVNDFDVYLGTPDTVEALAKYYLSKAEWGNGAGVVREGDRIKIVVPSDGIAEDATILQDPGDIEGQNEEAEQEALEREDEGKKYLPVFISTNAITLSGRVQIILRFHGKPHEIHENYDFVHCTNYWTKKDGVVLRQDALEAILTRELRYIGSKYPLCSIIRMRKFLRRHWSITAGTVVKICMNLDEYDLTDFATLEDQLTGVDVAYFQQVITMMKEKGKDRIDRAYLIEILDRMF